jgi:5-methylcytosine-specific restriction enzyme subunit McrC
MTVAAAKLTTGVSKEIGQIGRIPVRNLWLLMLYASEFFRDIDSAKVSVEDNPDDIPDLVAEILSEKE